MIAYLSLSRLADARSSETLIVNRLLHPGGRIVLLVAGRSSLTVVMQAEHSGDAASASRRRMADAKRLAMVSILQYPKPPGEQVVMDLSAWRIGK